MKARIYIALLERDLGHTKNAGRRVQCPGEHVTLRVEMDGVN